MFFLNLEKHCPIKNQICGILFESKHSPQEILNSLNLHKLGSNVIKLCNERIAKMNCLKP